MVWTYVAEKCRGISEKDAENGAARKEKMGNTIEEIYGCGEGRHVAATEEVTEDRRWEWMMGCGDPPPWEYPEDSKRLWEKNEMQHNSK